MASDDTRIPLRDGPAVPIVAIDWLLALADRGLSIGMGDDGRAHVTDPTRLTEDDHAIITAHRLAIREAVAYCDRIAALPIDSIGAPWPVRDLPAAAEPTQPAEPPAPREARLW